MRRRIRSAALPLHRHSLPQLVVDGALVALAYYLAFELRFNSGPNEYYSELREATIWWVLVGSLPVLVLSHVYERRWRYAGQRDYEAVVRAVVVIVLLTVVAVEVLRPVHRYPHRSTVAVVLPNGVIVLFAMLSLVFLVGVRAVARSVYERRPVGAFRGGRKGERTVLIAGAGEGGPHGRARDHAQPRARPGADRLRRRRPRQAPPADRRPARARHHRSETCPASSTRPSPTK